jgi:hypothetical protein
LHADVDEAPAGRREYVSRVPRPPLGGLIDDLYYLRVTRRTPD